MANLYVSYISGPVHEVAGSPLGSEVITTSGTSAKGTANENSGASIAIVVSDAAHYVTVGPRASVVAAAGNSIYVPANREREIAILPGQEVAAITV